MSTFWGAKEIYHNRGILGFWRGFLPNQFGNVQATAQMSLYQNMRTMLQKRKGDEDLSDLETFSISVSWLKKISTYNSCMCVGESFCSPNVWKYNWANNAPQC